MTRTFRSAAVIIIALTWASTFLPTPVSGQIDVDWYTLGVGSASQASDFFDSGGSLLGRGRVSVSYAADWVIFDVAYEHLLRRQPAGEGFSITSSAGSGLSSTDWLALDWIVGRSRQNEWRHRLDRLNLSVTKGSLEATVGRQAISWATTLFLTPSDPFTPFNPSDPFREYRGGVDAVRIRSFPGPFTEIEAVIRPANTLQGTSMTALARIGTSKGGWAFGGWAGLLHDDAAGAIFVSGGVGATALRGELTLREGQDGGTVSRVAVGLDRFYTPGGKNLSLVGEVQYDGFGTSDPGALLEVGRSDAFGRGEMQTLGRWTIATQISYQIHPLVGVDALTLLNADDHSGLLVPGVSWSMTSYASVRIGVFKAFGDGALGLPIPGSVPTGDAFNPITFGSEYGSVPTTGYVSVSMFF